MNQEEIGKVLKELRQRKGYTQKEIASSLVITPQTISKWENGLSYPSLDMLVALSKLYEVSMDELVSGDIENDVSVIKEEKNILYIVMTYVLLFVLLGLGITTLFVHYATTIHYFQQVTEHSFLYYDTPRFRLAALPSWIVLSMMIVSPIIIAFTSLLDKGKLLTMVLTLISFSVLSFELTTFMAHYEFYEPGLGMILHMTYLLVLLGVVVLSVLTSKTNLKDKLLENKKYLFVGSTLFLITFILPFPYTEVFYQEGHGWNVNYYFETLDRALIGLLYVMSIVALFSSYEMIKKLSTIIKIVLIITMLWATIVYIFNSGLIMTSILLYIYIILLGITFEKGDIKGFKIENIKGVTLIILEVISIVAALYLITLTGDIFFGENPVTGYHESIRYRDIGYGSLYALTFIFILVSMFLRFIRLEKVSYGIYGVWFLGQLYIMIDLFRRYILEGYHMTDGMFFFVPPLLIGGYYLIIIGLYYRRKLKKKVLS